MTPAAGDALAAAAGLRRRAVADLAGGRATRAVRDLTAALRLVTTAGPGARSPGGDRDPGRVSLHVACLLTMAVARLQTDGVSAAHRMLDEARTLAGDDDELITRWRTQRALVLGRSGELAAAEAELEVVSRHLDIFTPQERCSVLLNRGMVAVERARATDAIPLFAEAAEIATTYDLPRQRFMALHNAGYAAHLTGDLPAALAGMDAADAVEADVFRGPALLDRGRVLHEAGLLEESLEVLGEAAAVSGRRGHDLLRGEILLEIARVLLLLGDPVGATREARRARRRFVGAGAAGWVGRADVTILSARFVRGRGLAPLAAEVDALERMAIAAGDVELQARTVCLAAEIAARRHDPGAGRAALARHPGGDLGLAARLVRAHASVAVSLAAGRPHLAEAILRRSAPAPEKPGSGDRLVVGLLEIDVPEHRVLVHGETIPLTALEFKLLYDLASRPGRVQTREGLLERVWGYAPGIETRTVDTHVKRLREKLGAARDQLETIRGVGYRMKTE